MIGIFVFFNRENDKFSTNLVHYNGNDLRISIDGESASTLPTNGNYYLVDYDCSNINTKVTWNREDYSLDINNGIKKSNVACYLEFKSIPLLSKMPVGSYIAYTGDSSLGCDNTKSVNGYTSCSGKNANYESDTSMGFCGSSDYKFYVNGWRIAYIENESAHLISAGAPECICTNSDGVLSSSSCNSSLSSEELSFQFVNMNNIALKYCNDFYINDGICDSSSVWAMNELDFKKITGSRNLEHCSYRNSNMLCGYTNLLIDNGGLYMLATRYNQSTQTFYGWEPYRRIIFLNNSYDVAGVRPVLKLDPSVIVTGGDGSYENPYTIAPGE